MWPNLLLIVPMFYGLSGTCDLRQPRFRCSLLPWGVDSSTLYLRYSTYQTYDQVYVYSHAI